MQLYTLHKVLIAAAITMSLVLALWAGWMYDRHGSPAHLGMIIAAVAAAVAFAVYLRHFVRRVRATRSK